MRSEYPERDLFSPPPIKAIDFKRLGKKSRLVPILYALQSLYEERPDIIRMVYADLSEGVAGERGREGMNAWRTLVLQTVRTGMRLDYADLTDLARHHIIIRQFMGVSETEKFYPSESAVHANIMRLRPATIEAANAALVEIGKKKGFEDGRAVRGDSFVCRTNTHYPTDAGLIYDGVRKIIELSVELTGGGQGWRQSRHLLKKAKRLYRAYMQRKRSTRKREEKAAWVSAAMTAFTVQAREIIAKGLETYAAERGARRDLPETFAHRDRESGSLEEQLFYFLAGTEYVCRLAEQRVVEGAVIPHGAKVHSLFEPHTELINRGKYPQPIEFGHRVFLAQGRSGLILNHRVMGIGVTDDKILLPVLAELQSRIEGKLEAASFDKGFYTPDNLSKARQYCDLVVIPRKGRLDAESCAEESSAAYVAHRQWRSGVESLISAMVRSNGLDRCPDKGYERFEKYVSACVLSRNLQTLGTLLMEAEEQQASGRCIKRRA